MSSKMFRKAAPLVAVLFGAMAAWLSSQSANETIQRQRSVSSPAAQIEFSPAQLGSSNVEEQVEVRPPRP